MNKILTVIGVVVVVVVSGLIISRTGQDQSSPPTNDLTTRTEPSVKLEKAPDFNLSDFNGKIVSLADFKGRPLVLNVWAVWCPFCVKELPDFATVQKEFSDKIVIIAIDRAEPLELQKEFTDKLGVTNDLIFLLDPTDSFYQSIGGFSMPETIFVDKDGFIREHKRGPMDAEEIRQKVLDLINEK